MTAGPPAGGVHSREVGSEGACRQASQAVLWGQPAQALNSHSSLGLTATTAAGEDVVIDSEHARFIFLGFLSM